MAALAFPDNHCIISTNTLSQASSWATLHSYHPLPTSLPDGNNPTVAPAPKQSENSPKFTEIALGDSGLIVSPDISKSPPQKVPGPRRFGRSRERCGAEQQPCAPRRGGAPAAAAFALSTFPAPRSVRSPLYLWRTRAQGERRAPG